MAFISSPITLTHPPILLPSKSLLHTFCGIDYQLMYPRSPYETLGMDGWCGVLLLKERVSRIQIFVSIFVLYAIKIEDC